MLKYSLFKFMFFCYSPSPEIYTVSLHDALPISEGAESAHADPSSLRTNMSTRRRCPASCACSRSEEHTSELQSHVNLVCRLLLEKKKTCVTFSQITMLI